MRFKASFGQMDDLTWTRRNFHGNLSSIGMSSPKTSVIDENTNGNASPSVNGTASTTIKAAPLHSFLVPAPAKNDKDINWLVLCL